MRYRSKIDWWFKGIVWLSIAVTVMTLIWLPQEERLIGFGVGIPMICLLIWIFFGTYFEFKETYLLCRCGPFFERIVYEKIKLITKSENMLSSMALSRERVEIKQHGKGYILGTTYISPVNREEFVKELAKRCPNCDRRQPYC